MEILAKTCSNAKGRRSHAKVGQGKRLARRGGSWFSGVEEAGPRLGLVFAMCGEVRGGLQRETQFRVFSPNIAIDRGLKIGNYNNLESYPELIIFSG